MATKVRSKPYTLDGLAGSVSSLEDLRARAAQVMADADFMLDQLYKDLAAVASAAGSGSSGLSAVTVDGAGALAGDGTSGSPLKVKVDGTTITISGDQLVGTGLASVTTAAAGALSGNGTAGSPLAVKVDNSTIKITGNQLVGQRQAVNVDTTKGLAGDGNATALSVAVDGNSISYNGSGQLMSTPSGVPQLASITLTNLAGLSTTPATILAGVAGKVIIPTGLYMLGFKNGTAWTNGNNGFSLVYSNLTGNNLLASTIGLAMANTGTIKGMGYVPAQILNTSLSALAGISVQLKTALDFSGGSGTTVTAIMPYYLVTWSSF